MTRGSLQDITGQTFGRLTAIERVENLGRHAAWLCTCTCGNEAVVAGRHLRSGDTVSCGCWRRETAAANAAATRGQKRVKLPSYSGVHMRLRLIRGSASSYLCVVCGRQAQQWAYDWQDVGEIDSPVGPYSLNGDHYQPMCASDHKEFDLQQRRERERNA